MMRRTDILVSLAAFFMGAAMLGAQNLNPTIEVTRQFEGKLPEIVKMSPEVCVPDSLRKFNLDFDYSVFSKPYGGSYDFNPYIVDNRPSPGKLEEGTLWLRAGAGYTLHPTFDLVWSPVQLRDNFRLNVYASHNSYVGKYHTIGLKNNRLDKLGGAWNGYDLDSRADVDGRLIWSEGQASFDVSYQGLHTMDALFSNSAKSSYNSVETAFHLSQNDACAAHLIYGGDFFYRYANDIFPGYSPDSMNANEFEFNAFGGYAFNSVHRLTLAFQTENAFYSYGFNPYAGLVSIVPKYTFSYDRWNIEAGVKLSATYSGGDDYSPIYPGRLVYPDVKISYSAIWNTMQIYLMADGGNRINTYTSLKKGNHFATLWLYPSYSPQITADRVDARLGTVGSACSRRLKYDAAVGCKMQENRLFYALSPLTGSEIIPQKADVCFSDLNIFYVTAALGWKTPRVDASASARWNRHWGYGTNPWAFLPSEIEAEGSFEYNWNSRIFAGIGCRYASARKGMVASGDDYISIPWMLDLNARASYRINKKFDVWIEGGNFLNMAIQTAPLVAEKGVRGTLGFTFRM